MTPGRWVTVAFGPLAYRVPSPVPEDLRAFVTAPSAQDAPCVAGDDLADRVVLDAPTVGCVVLHAAAVTVAGGVVLLVAPPGTGKTTAAVNAGERAVAHNGVLVCPGPDAPHEVPRVWALPFAGGPPPRPRVVSLVAHPLRAVLALVRGTERSLEWLPGAAATTYTLRASVRPRGGDPHAAARAVIALALAGKVRAGRITLPMSPTWLATLDNGIKGL